MKKWLVIWIFCLAAVISAGFSAAGHNAQGAPPSQRTIAVTVDDLPGAIPGNDFAMGDLKELQKINHAIPAILKSHHAWAIGFVNERKLQVQGERDARAGLLQMWLDAELTLGNHTFSHADFQITPLAQYEDETIRGEVVTTALLKAQGQTEKYFRHPYLNTGPTAEAKTAFEGFLKERGYTIAPVTVEDADYVFNDVLQYAAEKKDKKLAARAKKEYLEYAETSLNYSEGLSRDLFGREVPQTLLIHDNQLNSECLDALLAQIEHRGYKFISLDQALADPAYSTADNYVGATGISWLLRWRVALGQPVNSQQGPEPPAWANTIFEQMRKERQKH